MLPDVSPLRCLAAVDSTHLRPPFAAIHDVAGKAPAFAQLTCSPKRSVAEGPLWVPAPETTPAPAAGGGADTESRERAVRPQRGATVGPKACRTLAGSVSGEFLLVTGGIIGTTVYKDATDAILGDNKNKGWFEMHASGSTSQVRR